MPTNYLRSHPAPPPRPAPAPRWPPEARLRRLGATSGQCREARRRWQELTEAERFEAWDAMACLSDEEVREQLRDMPEAEPQGLAVVPGSGAMAMVDRG